MRDKGALRKGLGWAGVVGTGALAGLLLGHHVIDSGAATTDGIGSYAQFAGNPEALGVASAPIEPCYDCTASYYPAVPPSGRDRERMGEAFRELGAIEIDHAAPATNDYSYGGRFDDPSAARRIVMQSPVSVSGEATVAPADSAEPTAPPAPTASPEIEQWTEGNPAQ